ncbi:MAG: type II and III secretion system protein [Rhodothermales bacterium]|nr:type II and III secretion system protein [Rhodothermales bacterium]
MSSKAISNEAAGEAAGKRAAGSARLLPFVLATLILGTAWAALSPLAAEAQRRLPPQVRTYIPPEQLASFLPSTPFNQFVSYLNPIFSDVTGKQVIDPESRTFPIGVTVAGLHFFDAFELILDSNGLTYRETDQFFIVEEAPAQTTVIEPPGTMRTSQRSPDEILATHETREIQINAVLFEIDHSNARELGIDWSRLFPSSQGQQGGQQGGSQDERVPEIQVRTDRLFNRVDDYIVGPDQVDAAFLNSMFRVLETTGAGETLAQPSVSVQSGEEGRIQIGSDIPVTVRDFAGNTVTQFISTGIIINVVPTLIESPLADTAGAPTLDFIHMNVQVERSSGRPFGGGVAIDRNQATTKVLLLDREQTVIGGLYSTEQIVNRRGIPILKDLPPWFFGLRYIFGYETTQHAKQELLIVLQARLVDPLEQRNQRPLPDELLQEYRERMYLLLDNFNETSAREGDNQPFLQNQ